MKNNLDQLTKKQRVFAEVYVNNGKNASQAYREAYGSTQPDNSIRSSASRLLRNDNVREAVVYLLQENLKTTQRKQDIERDFLIAEYLDVLRLSKEHKQLSTARQTLDSLAHLAGFWSTNKTEMTTNVNIDATLQQLGTDELLTALQTANDEPAVIEGNFKPID